MSLQSRSDPDLDVELDLRGRDAPDDGSAANPYRQIVGHWWRVLVAVVVVGLVLALVHHQFPLLRPGSRVMETAKTDYLTAPGLYDTEPDAVKVAVVGNSRVLAGFVPAEFDAHTTCSTLSVNAGFPAAVDFVPHLMDMVEAGNVPDVVLVQRQWGGQGGGAEGPGERVGEFFDFRFLLRDVSAFVDEAGGPLGALDHYRLGSDAVEQMEADRGWYFIEGESLYPDDQLPDDLVVASDQPTVEFRRTVRLTGPSYRVVTDLIADGVEFIFVPNPEREPAFAEPAPVSHLRDELAGVPGVSVAGPELLTYPNALFADPVHLNPAGAARWSTDVASLVDQAICDGG